MSVSGEKPDGRAHIGSAHVGTAPGPPPAGVHPDDLELWAWMAPFIEVWATMPAGVVVGVGPTHRLIFQNDVSKAMFGIRPLGLSMAEAFPETSAARIAHLDRAFHAGIPASGRRQRLGVRGLTGGLQADYVFAPLSDPAGVVVGVVVTSLDLSAQTQAEIASNRAAMLTSLAERMIAAPDANAALSALTQVLVPRLADVATVYVMPDDDSSLRRPFDPHDLGRPDPGGAVARKVAPSLAHLGAPPPSPPLRRDRPPWPDLAAGRGVILPGPSRPDGLMSSDPATQEWVTRAGGRTIAILPLVVAGTLTGALVLLAAGDRDPYTAADLPFLTDVAARAATAIAQVRAHHRQAAVSRDLQHALLPATPPRVRGLSIAARYVAGAPEVDVGGDWWDVVRLGTTAVAIGVGDVSGRGIEAAVVMGQARAAMRAAALAGLGPAEVLALLDAQVGDLLAERRGPGDDGPVFATAVHVILDLDTGGARMANAAHPPALLHVPGRGVVRWAGPPCPPLALNLGGYTEHLSSLPVGTSLLLYTDGLVESRYRDLDRGLEHLEGGALERVASLDVEEALDRILDELTAARPDSRTADDIVLLLVRREQEQRAQRLV